MALRSIILAIAICAVCTPAQLTFHTDPSTSSFTLQTPSLQQTYTRYYGGQKQGGAATTDGLLGLQAQFQNTQQPQQQQPQKQQQQPQQFTPTPQNPGYTFQNDQAENNYYQGNQQVVPQRNAFQQQNYYQQQQQQQQQPQPSVSAQDLAAYFQQVRAQQQPQYQQQQPQQQQQQQQQQQPQQQHQYQQPQSDQIYNAYQPQRSASSAGNQPNLPDQNEQLSQGVLGVAFSPSNEVSQVNFSSGSGVKYNF